MGEDSDGEEEDEDTNDQSNDKMIDEIMKHDEKETEALGLGTLSLARDFTTPLIMILQTGC